MEDKTRLCHARLSLQLLLRVEDNNIMSSHVHIGLYDALREAGASEEKERIAAGDFPGGTHLASKEDLLQAIGEGKTEVANLRGDVKVEIAGVKTEIANFKASLYWTAWILGGSIVTLTFTLIKLFP